MSTRILARLMFSSSKYCRHRKCYSFKNYVALLPWFHDCHFDGFVSSNVRYVTCSHGTDCHAELPAGRVQCFKIAKIDSVSPFYPTLWLKKASLQWENLQEVRKTSLWAVNIYFCAFRNCQGHNYCRPTMKIPELRWCLTKISFNNPSQFPGMF